MELLELDNYCWPCIKLEYECAGKVQYHFADFCSPQNGFNQLIKKFILNN